MKNARNTLFLGSVLALAACGGEMNDMDSLEASELGQTQAPLLKAEPGKAIPGAYIVKLRDGAQFSTLGNVMAEVKTRHQYSIINGFAADLDEKQLDALRRNPMVEYVEEDGVASIDATQTGAPWGLDRIDQKTLPLNGTYIYTSTASNINAYIIDTGIYTAHSNFGGRATNVYDAFGGTGADCNGHGTHVAGTVGGSTYGVAKAVKLRGVRVLDCNGSGSWSGVIAGMDWVRLNHVKPAVANMSLGGAANTSVNTAATNLSNAGVFVAVAAGNNSGANACSYSPAGATNVTTVGSTASNDTRSSFSNIGSCVDIYAPGSNILSTSSSGGTATMSGTSMASPHVAGVGALYKATYGDASSATINTWLVNNGTTLSFGKLLYKSSL
ncbi:S8 family peptidase [Hyalangium rubrum]|uniref:S8 family peptidase n=1 Tax=Hyalangium rubrum TaxID=3103134 RepID=A0ABU5HH46_9BACT|nr:S8 family peptidase [Hyalangium sp. s54d21]MDY7232793.1 S8 family peptidase [Hyalangium sp. s54d21]